MSQDRIDERIDFAFDQIGAVREQTATNTARLDGINGQITRLASEQARMNEKLEEDSREMRDRFAALGNELREVAVRTSLICSVVVAVVTAAVGGAGIYVIKHTVHSELHPVPAQAQPAITPASYVRR
jgi:predicted nuclease with TOPRIM domain